MSFPVSTRNQFGSLFGEDKLPVLEELFMMSYEAVPSVREQLLDVKYTTNDIWQSQDIEDLPLLNEIAEGEEYTYSRPQEGGQKTFVPKKKGGGFSISQEMVDDAKFGVMGEWARKQGNAAYATQEIAGLSPFNNAFTTELAQDNLPVINAAHKVGATTFSNVIDGNPDLTPNSLEAAVAMFKRRFINGQGAIYNIAPRILVVSPENYLYALEITKSLQRADTANNNMNSLSTLGLKVVSSPYLTDPDAWFLQADPAQTGLKLVIRQGIRTSVSPKEVGFHTDSLFFKISYREAIGVSRAQGIMGSSGAE